MAKAINFAGVKDIHIIWQGPLSIETVRRRDSPDQQKHPDYGIYQIYGSHAITGPHTLLYVGKADKTTFSNRLDKHENEWTRWEPEPVQIYLGRVARRDSDQPTDNQWSLMIDQAEAIIIYFSAPSYNCARVRDLRYKNDDLVLVNHKQRGRLPYCMSTITERLYPDNGLSLIDGRPTANTSSGEEDVVRRR